ncbi:MAG: DsrE family protein [Thermaurantimonas sp.]
MNRLLLLFGMYLLCHNIFAQGSTSVENEPLRIVFQVTTDDTLAHKALMKQLTNITSVEPAVQIEVICHGPGLTLIQKSKSLQKEKIALFASRGVAFKACEFSMSERKVSKDDILEAAGYVRAGIVHIADLQRKGWSYIKAGF